MDVPLAHFDTYREASFSEKGASFLCCLMSAAQKQLALANAASTTKPTQEVGPLRLHCFSILRPESWVFVSGRRESAQGATSPVV